MDFAEIQQFISNVGFPIFMAVILVLYQSKALNKMNDTLIELKALIENLTKKEREDDE